MKISNISRLHSWVIAAAIVLAVTITPVTGSAQVSKVGEPVSSASSAKNPPPQSTSTPAPTTKAETKAEAPITDAKSDAAGTKAGTPVLKEATPETKTVRTTPAAGDATPDGAQP